MTTARSSAWGSTMRPNRAALLVLALLAGCTVRDDERCWDGSCVPLPPPPPPKKKRAPRPSPERRDDRV